MIQCRPQWHREFVAYQRDALTSFFARTHCQKSSNIRQQNTSVSWNAIDNYLRHEQTNCSAPPSSVLLDCPVCVQEGYDTIGPRPERRTLRSPPIAHDGSFVCVIVCQLHRLWCPGLHVDIRDIVPQYPPPNRSLRSKDGGDFRSQLHLLNTSKYFL